MSAKHLLTIGQNNEIPLPDDICTELHLNVGDILQCKVVKPDNILELKKHHDQSLSDDEIEASGYLTRVFECLDEVKSN